MSAPNFKAANDFIEFKAGINHFPISELKLKKKSIKWDRVIFTLFIIGLGSYWGIQTFNNKTASKADNDYTSAKAIYEQNERKIAAMQAAAKIGYEANTIAIIKFRDYCYNSKMLKMPLSPACKEVLK